jgi:putative DNA primase/helicase
MNAAELAQAFGLRRHGRSWSGDCPACGYAGTFSVADKEGRTLWHCASCQDRDAVTAAVRNVTARDWTAPPTPAPERAVDPASRIRAAMALWDASIPTAGTLAEVYLAARGLAGEASTALRFHPALRHPNATGTFPALVALIVSTSTGEPVAIHRTYLRRDGAGKADVDPAKASKGPMGGGAIMLHAPEAGRPLVIVEGIETSLSAGRMMNAPAWAAVAAGNMQRIAPPADPSEIIIAADPDLVGQFAAWAAADVWQAAGRRVRVATPDTTGQDFNDLWRARTAREATNG